MTVITVCPECSKPVVSMGLETFTVRMADGERSESVALVALPCRHQITTAEQFNDARWAAMGGASTDAE